MQIQEPNRKQKRRPISYEAISYLITISLGLVVVSFLTIIVLFDQVNAGIILTGLYASIISLVVLIIIGRTYIFTEVFDKGRFIRNSSITIVLITIAINIIIRVVSFFSRESWKYLYTASGWFSPYSSYQFSLLAIISKINLVLTLIGSFTFLFIIFINLFSKQLIV